MDDRPTSPTLEPARAEPDRTKPSSVAVWIAGAVVVVLAAATVIAFRPHSGQGDRSEPTPDASAPPPALGAGQGAVKVGDAAPDVSFERFDGSEASLADYRGKPLVVNFFASYCTPCVTEMPEFEALHKRLGEEVTFIGIDVSEPVDAGQRIVDQTGVTYGLGRDPTGRIMRDMGGVAMPTTVLITADGKVAQIHSGQLSGERLDQYIHEKLLS